MRNPHLDGLLQGTDYHSGIPPSGTTYLEPLSQERKGGLRRFVIPGPGAVLVKTPDRPDYRPAYVDPKAFFAPAADWTAEESDLNLRHARHPDDPLRRGQSGLLRRDRAR